MSLVQRKKYDFLEFHSPFFVLEVIREWPVVLPIKKRPLFENIIQEFLNRWLYECIR